MNYKMIGIKELHQDLRLISQEALLGQSYLVIKNSKPVFRIEPIELDADKKTSLKDLSNLQFKSRDKNLSKNIDKIIY